MSGLKVGPKKDWTLTPRAFHRLLDWLDEGGNSEGKTYLQMRKRLVAYFDRKNCLTPDELADETLNRVTRRLEEEGAIETDTPAKYCYTIARFVFMEYLRRSPTNVPLLDDARRQSVGSNPAALTPEDKREAMHDCLERCTGKLETANRNIIIRYYIGKERTKIENRRALADELGITMNALSIRACRIRDVLEDCVRQCLGSR
jgi:DNA-directed RNA polymerase specialized sigma24 family protein